MRLSWKMTVALFLFVATTACGSGGDGNDGTGGTSGSPGGSTGTSTAKDRIYVGSCTGKDGMCMSQWQPPEDGLDLPAMFESVCTSQGGSYSASYICSGGVPGCCTLPPSSDNTLVKTCYKVTDGDPEGILRRQCVDGFQGTFE